MDKRLPTHEELALATTRPARLKLARQLCGLTAAEAAKRIDASSPAMSKWENERVPDEQSRISLDMLLALCSLYGVRIEWVLFGTLPMESTTSAAPEQVDPLLAAVTDRLNKHLTKSPKAISTRQAAIQSLLLAELFDALDDTDRELLTLYLAAKNKSDTRAYSFMLIAMKAAMNSVLSTDEIETRPNDGLKIVANN